MANLPDITGVDELFALMREYPDRHVQCWLGLEPVLVVCRGVATFENTVRYGSPAAELLERAKDDPSLGFAYEPVADEWRFTERGRVTR